MARRPLSHREAIERRADREVGVVDSRSRATQPRAQLFTYQCGVCKSVAVCAHSAAAQRRLRCLQCHSFMRFVCCVPVTTPEQAALHARGIVWNPGSTKETV